MRYIGLTTGSNAPQAQKTFKRFEAYCATRGDGYDYSKVEFEGISKYVTIICPKHGEFEQHARRHEKGQGCPACSYEARGEARVLGKKEFLKRVGHFGYTYPNLSNNVKVSDIVNCVCDTHGAFKQRASEQIAGCGCQSCGLESQTKWNKEKAQIEALKYTNRTEMVEDDGGLYKYIQANGYIDELLAHMPHDSKYTDGDMVYIWRVPNTNIYKIGVSSVRLGDARINQVAKELDKGCEVIGMYEVSNAFEIEKELHSTYQIEPTTLPVFNGSTEFRILGESDVNEITYYLENVVGKKL